MQLCFREERLTREPALGVGDNSREQVLIMLEHLGNCVRIKQVRVVYQFRFQSLSYLSSPEVDVKLRDAAVEIKLLNRQAGNSQRFPGEVSQLKHHLEKR